MRPVGVKHRESTKTTDNRDPTIPTEGGKVQTVKAKKKKNGGPISAEQIELNDLEVRKNIQKDQIWFSLTENTVPPVLIIFHRHLKDHMI